MSNTKTHRRSVRRVEKLDASDYFATIRRLSSDPQVWVAADKAEAELKAKHDKK